MTTIPAVTPDALSEYSTGELRRDLWRRWLDRISVFLGWIAFVVIWYALSNLVFDTRRLPEPHVILGEMWSVIIEGGFRSNMQSSLIRVIEGFILALVVSIGLGWLIAYNAWWRALLQTIMQFVASAPIVSLAVLTLIVFGISTLGPVLVTALVATPYIVVNVAQGLTGVDRGLIIMSESFARTRIQIIWGVLFPASMLSVLAGTRFAFAVAWRMELLTEVFAASEGVGFQIRRSYESFDIREMIAWTVLFIAVMLIFENLVLRQIERRIAGRRM